MVMEPGCRWPEMFRERWQSIPRPRKPLTEIFSTEIRVFSGFYPGPPVVPVIDQWLWNQNVGGWRCFGCGRNWFPDPENPLTEIFSTEIRAFSGFYPGSLMVPVIDPWLWNHDKFSSFGSKPIVFPMVEKP